MGDQTHGIDPIKIDTYAKEIKKALTKVRNSYRHRWRKYL